MCNLILKCIYVHLTTNKTNMRRCKFPPPIENISVRNCQVTGTTNRSFSSTSNMGTKYMQKLLHVEIKTKLSNPQLNVIDYMDFSKSLIQIILSS